VHGQVDPAGEHRQLHLLHEGTLAPDLVERQVRELIAARGDDHDLDVDMHGELTQHRGHQVALQPGERGAPGGQTERSARGP